MEDSAMIPVVVLAYNGTEPLMRALWEKSYSGAFKILSVPDNYSLLDVAGSILADTEIDKDFVLVQANTFPIVKIDLETLKTPAVYITANGVKQYNSRVPVRLNKDRLADLLSSLEKESDFKAETFMKEAAILPARPIEVGHSFGNYIFQVTSGNPCHHRVIEGLLQRIFMGTTLTGWRAIEGELNSLLKSKTHE